MAAAPFGPEGDNPGGASAPRGPTACQRHSATMQSTNSRDNSLLRPSYQLTCLAATITIYIYTYTCALENFALRCCHPIDILDLSVSVHVVRFWNRCCIFYGLSYSTAMNVRMLVVPCSVLRLFARFAFAIRTFTTSLRCCVLV